MGKRSWVSAGEDSISKAAFGIPRRCVRTIHQHSPTTGLFLPATMQAIGVHCSCDCKNGRKQKNSKEKKKEEKMTLAQDLGLGLAFGLGFRIEPLQTSHSLRLVRNICPKYACIRRSMNT